MRLSFYFLYNQGQGDPKESNDLLEEYKDIFPNSIVGFLPDMGVQLSYPLKEDADEPGGV